MVKRRSKSNSQPTSLQVRFIKCGVLGGVKIQVRLFSYFCNLIGEKENRCSFNIEIKDGSTCGDLLSTLNISSDLPMVILVNGLVKGQDSMLGKGDVVEIIPPIEGG